ncbi:putative Selenide, water dikinase [Proteus penneri ATCC 35198]|nr:putative Selenide, water dikinase [Proteus penneri ATCC 35198]
MSEAIRLTQYSHGAGCGCKISPKVLETILHSEQAKFHDPHLLVGNETKDDAAVYDLGNGTGIISTTDFFLCQLLITLMTLGVSLQQMQSAIFLQWVENLLWRLLF